MSDDQGRASGTESARRIVIRVAVDGSVTAETSGILGERCLDYLPVLEDLLEARTVSSVYTADRDRVAETDPVPRQEVLPREVRHELDQP
ncbi:MAG: DUF2997 domain-containing protein [Actinomycetales bacterium]|nr:DUF2997 domain-containing protein [Actinomycetales bacterium]